MLSCLSKVSIEENINIPNLTRKHRYYKKRSSNFLIDFTLKFENETPGILTNRTLK